MYNKFEYPSYKVENGRHPQIQTHMDAIDASKRGGIKSVYSFDKEGVKNRVATYYDGKVVPTEVMNLFEGSQLPLELLSKLSEDCRRLWKRSVFKQMK